MNDEVKSGLIAVVTFFICILVVSGLVGVATYYVFGIIKFGIAAGVVIFIGIVYFFKRLTS